MELTGTKSRVGQTTDVRRLDDDASKRSVVAGLRTSDQTRIGAGRARTSKVSTTSPLFINAPGVSPAHLTTEQLRQLHEVGFVIVRNVFSKSEVARMSRAFDRLQKTASTMNETTDHEGTRFVVNRTDDDQVRIDRVVWVGGAEPELLRVGDDPRLLHLASQALDSVEMDQLINQAHFKQPGDGVAFEWHQDSQNRRYGTEMWLDGGDPNGAYIQTLTAVDEVTADNGPVMFLEGTAQLGHLGLEPDERRAYIAALLEKQDPVPALMQPGDVALFGPFTIHGSTPNTSDGPRRVLINGYAKADVNRREYPGAGLGRRVVAP